MRGVANSVVHMRWLQPLPAMRSTAAMARRFREVIHKMEHVIFSAAQLHDTCEMLSIPVIVTEQYPKALKHTVLEIDVKRDNTTVVEKTMFSMVTPVRCFFDDSAAHACSCQSINPCCFRPPGEVLNAVCRKWRQR
eukprot:COSAG02_NODE_4889_length_4860_cov_4.713716_1_plen_136_part_00